MINFFALEEAPVKSDQTPMSSPIVHHMFCVMSNSPSPRIRKLTDSSLPSLLYPRLKETILREQSPSNIQVIAEIILLKIATTSGRSEASYPATRLFSL